LSVDKIAFSRNCILFERFQGAKPPEYLVITERDSYINYEDQKIKKKIEIMLTIFNIKINFDIYVNSFLLSELFRLFMLIMLTLELEENPEIYYYIGQSYFQQGQHAAQNRNIRKATSYYRQAFEVSDTAIEKYQKKIAENPEEDHTNDYLQLAYIYQIRSLIPGVNEYQEALNIYQKLLIEKPRLTYVYYHMGWIYYQLEDYHNAITTYLKYLESGVKSDFVYYHLGLCYDKIGEREQAEYYFKLILEEFPDTDMAKRAKKELN
jgi:tetratricopeptide (TPR) repeat protein